MFLGSRKAIVALAFALLLAPALVSAATFERPLSQGMSGTDVSALQTVLREKGFYTYPEITGYFGAVTLQAVANFQTSQGLEPLGHVGPATRALLNGEAAPAVSSPSLLSSLITQLQQLLRNLGFYAVELTGTLDQATLSAAQSLSSGTNAAPQRSGGKPPRNAEEEVAVPDTTAPVLSSISSGTPDQASVTITWTTDEDADSRVDLGLTTSYGTASTSAALSTSHSITYTGLTENTTYHFRVQSTDASSNTATSSDLTFTTLGYDIDAAALFARMSSQPDSERKVAINTLIVSLKSAGVWNKLDVLYLLAADTEQAALLNWKDSTKNLTKTGTMSFVLDTGMQGDGSTGHLLGIGTPAGLTQYQQDSGHIGTFVTQAGNQTGHVGRTGSSGETILLAAVNGADLTARVNSDGATTAPTWTVEGSIGHTVVSRTGASEVTAYKNGTSLGAASSTSKARQALALAIGRYSGTYSTDTIAAVSLGAGLSSVESAALSEALETYMITLGWEPVADVQTRTLTLDSAVNAPDASGGVAGEGFTITGLVHDPIDGTWWVGNDGRGLPNDTSFEPSVVHLSADFTTKIGEMLLSSIATSSVVSTSIQGVAYDTSDNTLWFVAKDTVGSNTKIYHVSKEGAYLGNFAGSSSFNGLAYDSLRDQLIVSGTTGFAWRNKTTFAQVGYSFRTVGSPDQLFYDAANDYVLYTTGANGTNGRVKTVDIANQWGTPVTVKSETLMDADAIEGISIVNGTLYETNDGFFHPGNPVKNRVLIYDY